MLSTEVSAPSTPSNTGMKRQVDIQQSCDGCDATACMAVAMAPLVKHRDLESVSESKQCRCCYSLKPSQDKCKTSMRDIQRQCCLSSGRIGLTSQTTLSDDLAS